MSLRSETNPTNVPSSGTIRIVADASKCTPNSVGKDITPNTSVATAEMLTEQRPRVEVFTLMSVSGVDDSSEPGSGIDFKSRNEDRISVSEVPMLTPAELITLPKGQAFALLEGGQLWKIRMPLPVTDTDMPKNLTEIANEMERTYITNDHWYRVQEPWWAAVADVTEPTAEVGASDG